MSNQLTRRQKRYKAKRLFLTNAYTSKQICAMVEVTEATMSKWIKRHGWRDPESAGLRIKVNVFSIIQSAFIDHLKDNNPDLYILIRSEIMAFMGIKKQKK